ncbi:MULTISPECIES: helix-turn-helix domain-containing protein [unclassified Enterococcus]|uniref:helix-turn-helix domain-containing protein n=1 Tax=unclassified Enterococcus TaxID=2608891 RepID=UPI001CE0E805|nr:MULTISPECIES: helix-turn-helix domain-containing protein [unclassified Enterococcus]MCA5013522.1 helix-turn-helix domain-containing protein [Enterococcus sp. S23]MCA5016772.1 helix-turn-helix domain-containing protein [Enterococcus sp. S22(2020)]
MNYDSDFNYNELLSPDLLLERELALFLDMEERYISIEELSNKFDVSIKRIRRVVKLLQDDILEYDHQGFVFSICKSKGILLKVPINDDLKHFIAFIIQKNPLIKMLKEICLNEFVSVRDYAHRFYFSEATVRRNIKKIKKFLSQFDISLTRETIVLQGEEQQIRFFMLLFFWRLNSGISWPFTHVNEVEVEHIVHQFNELDRAYNKEVTRLEKRRRMYYIAIVKIRTRKKNYIQQNIEWDKASKNNKFFKEFRTVFYRLNNVLYAPPEEIAFHYEVWKSCSWVPDMQQVFAIETLNGSVAAKASTLFFDRFADHFFEMNLIEKKIAEEFIFCVHTLCFNFKKFNSDINGYYYQKQIQKYYPKLQSRLEVFIDELYAQSGYSLFLERDFLITHYSMLFSNLKKTNEYEKTIRVAIETDLPNILWELLCTQVHETFSRKYKLDINNSGEIKNEEDVDVILTTVPLRGPGRAYQEEKVVAINSELQRADIRKIEYVFDYFLQN